MGVVSPWKEHCLQNHGNYLPKPELQKRACTLEESNQLPEKKDCKRGHTTSSWQSIEAASDADEVFWVIFWGGTYQ